jgi:predicted ArsR family transcriptional regulator
MGDPVPAEMSKRFWETTRGRVLGLLRTGPRTVEDLARDLALTDNAIRAHLATLERDGLVIQQGTRRGAGAGKPALIYGLGPGVAVRLSRAYAPVLGALLDELSGQLTPEQIESLMLAAGKRLGAGVSRRAGPFEKRAAEAVALLHELGSDATLVPEGSGFRLQGSGCPLSAAVSQRPETCRALQGFLSEVMGVPVVQCCEQGSNPRCCFTVSSAA